MRDIGSINANALQPVCPVRSAIQVDQRKFEDIGGFIEAAAARQQFGTANDKKLLRAEPNSVKPRPVTVPVAYCQVDLFSREVNMMQRRGNPKINVGVGFGKMAEPVYQPFGGEIRRGTDGQHACVLALKKAARCRRQYGPTHRVSP